MARKSKKKNKSKGKQINKKSFTPPVQPGNLKEPEVKIEEAAPQPEAAEEKPEQFTAEEIHLIYEAVKFYKNYWAKVIDLNDVDSPNQLEKTIRIHDAYEHVEEKYLKVFATWED